jgi:hypothetical protein
MPTVHHESARPSRRARSGPFRATSETRARKSSQSQSVSAAPGAGGAEARPAAAAPWHYAKDVSALLDPGAETRVSRRHVRHAQRAVLWRESRLERVRKCGRVTHGGDGGLVRVRAKEQPGAQVLSQPTPIPETIAHYSGLTSCGSIWACPCCNPKIRNGRSIEISAAAAEWDRAGNSVLMVTLTFPHDLGMRLSALLPLLADGFRAVIRGRPWRRVRDQLAIVGTIRAIEVTHGESGWHPHAHVLVFARGELGAEGIAALAVYVRTRWAKWITSQGYRLPHETHGVDISICTSAGEAGNYVAKLQDGRSAGNELARGDLKQGRNGSRTPFEILDDFRWTGDVEDLALWHEYETATKGHQAITWSKGLRAILGAEQERTDEELAAEEVGGEDLAVIPAEVWSGIVAIPGLDAALLDAAERSGLDGMNKLLARHGLGQALPPGSA